MEEGSSRPRYWRKIVQASAWDSPNVQLGLRQQEMGVKPTGEYVIDGVLGWADFLLWMGTCDEEEKCVKLHGKFYKGKTLLLFPPVWLSLANERAQELKGYRRQAKAIGIDPAEGGDKTTMSAVDEHGLIELVGRKTPDTSDIPAEAVEFMKRHHVPADMVFFDRGGGGKQAADYLRKKGHDVRTVAFGESVGKPVDEPWSDYDERIDTAEKKHQYKSRRVQMYHLLSQAMDPSNPDRAGKPVFAIPPANWGPLYADLNRQLSVIPKQHDGEGVFVLPPKHKKDRNDKRVCLSDLCGHSPDELDSLVLANYGMYVGASPEVGAW